MGQFNLFVLCFALASSGGVSGSGGHLQRRQPGLTLPDCASQCLTTLLPTSQCEASDTTCLCSDSMFLQVTATCAETNCTVRDALTATRIQTTELCPQQVRDESHETQIVIWTLFGVAAFSVVARLISRAPAVGGSGFGADDWTILLALALLIPLDVVCYLMTLNGLGQDIWMLELYEITRILYYFWIDEFLYTFILNITKISVLLLYLRMWPDADSRKFRNSCLVVIGVLVVHAVVMNIVLAAGCEPVSYSWTQWDGEHEGHCINMQGQIYATAALNILFDLLVFLLPVPKLVKLSFSSPRKKIALCLTFMVGLFVTVCSIIRLQYLAVWGDSSNLSWGYNPIAIWSNVECNASVLCACMPSLAGLIQRIWARVTGTPLSSYGRGSVTAREVDMPGGYELRLRSASLSGPTGRETNDTPVEETSRQTFQGKKNAYDSDSTLGTIPAPPPPETTQEGLTSWYATRPLPLPGQRGTTKGAV